MKSSGISYDYQQILNHHGCINTMYEQYNKYGAILLILIDIDQNIYLSQDKKIFISDFISAMHQTQCKLIMTCLKESLYDITTYIPYMIVNQQKHYLYNIVEVSP